MRSLNASISILAIVFFMLSVVSLATLESSAATESSSVLPKVIKVKMSEEMTGSRVRQLFQERITQERTEAEQKVQPVAEALSALDETRAAVKYLDQRNTTKASMALEKASGKLDFLLAQYPNLSQIPLSADVHVLDLIANEKMIRTIPQKVAELVKRGEFQGARRVLRNYASEINVASTNLPMGTFPVAIQEASRLMNEGRFVAAKIELLAALNSLVLIENVIPLPVVKAQAMIDEVNRQVNERKINNSEANQLLNHAESQLRIAESMGYGTTKQDYANLQSLLTQLQSDINQNKENKGVLSKIIDDLKSLKR